MARPPTGQIVERDGARGRSFALRFRAYGRREFLTLGLEGEPCSECGAPVTAAHAAEELDNVRADVRRGTWRTRAAAQQPEPPKEEPTFHVFASEWIAARELEGLADKTIVDLRWSLSNHLLPFFAGHRLSEITPQEIDRFKVGKVRERQELDEARAREEKVPRGLSNNSINHVLSDLAQVLETAVEYGLLDANPAAGKRRRLKSERPSRPWVEPEQLPSLLDAASGVGRVLLGILAGSGLRIGEALSLRWQHVDLAVGVIHVGNAKTAAGIRSVDLTAALREELVLWRAESGHVEPDDYVLATSTGGKQNPSNLRRDVLKPAVETASAGLAKSGITPIDEGLGFHGLRRTYASLRCASGDDVAYTSAQIGIPIRASPCAATRRPPGAASDSQGRTFEPTTGRSNGHKWALAPFLRLRRFHRRQQKTPSSGAF
jgi:integrase